MEKRELLHEGKAKRIYATDNSYYVVQEFKDTISAFDGAKKSVMAGKGEINNEISCYLFEYLNNYQIPTHFVQRLSATEMLVKKLEMIPIEVVMRNIAAGSLVKRYGIEEAKVLDYPIFELYLKDDERHDPMISESFTFALGHCTPEQMRFINRITSKVNAVLKSLFDRRGLALVDFKLEFGKMDREIFLADEISPDTCRIWDKKTSKKLDKDRFRKDMGDVEASYRELMRRIMNMPPEKE